MAGRPAQPAKPADSLWTFRLPILLYPWAFAVAFALLIGLFRNINLLLLLGYLLLAVPLLNVLTAAWPLRGLRAKRRIAGQVVAGVPCAVTIRVAPPAGRSRLAVRVEDVGPAHRLTWFADGLDGDGRSFRGHVVLPRRGCYAWGPVLASSGYPFGLAYRRKELIPAEEVIVLPRVGRLHRGLFRRLLRGAASDPDRRRRLPRPHAAAQDQFHGLRPFRPGDNPRTIHWRTSARRGERMVREFEDLPGDNLLLVFDPLLEAAEGPALSRGRLDDFEAAVSLAATAAVEWRGDRLIVAVADEDPEMMDGASGATHTRRVLERLAVVEPLATTTARAQGALLERLAEARSAAVVVVGVGRGRLAGVLRQALGRPVLYLDAAALDEMAFYEPPGTND
jgi:uncharacterized protein (DUF58 family)